MNTGSLPIRRDHIVSPLNLGFPPEVKVLDTPMLIYQNPTPLGLQLSVSKGDRKKTGDSLSITWDLLNSGEEVAFQVVLEGDEAIPYVTGHIEGVNELDVVNLPQPQNRSTKRHSMALLVGISAVLGLPILAWRFAPSQYSPIAIVVSALGLVALAIAAFFSAWHRVW